MRHSLQNSWWAHRVVARSLKQLHLHKMHEMPPLRSLCRTDKEGGCSGVMLDDSGFLLNALVLDNPSSSKLLRSKDMLKLKIKATIRKECQKPEKR